jgi:hypothetical protein
MEMSYSENDEIVYSRAIEDSLDYLVEIDDCIEEIQGWTGRQSEIWQMCQKYMKRKEKFIVWLKNDWRPVNPWNRHKHNIENVSDYYMLEQLYFDLIDVIIPQYEKENRSMYAKYKMNKSRTKNLAIRTKIMEKFGVIIEQFRLWNSMFEFEADIGPTRWKDIVKPKEELCCVCLCTEREIVCYPCMHACLCKECYRFLDPKKCPICRKIIEDVRSITHLDAKKTQIYRSQVDSIHDLTSLLAKLKAC